MNGDDDIKDMFDRIDFRGEPPMESMIGDDLRRGRRRLRTRRAATWTTGVAGVAVLGAGVAVALPGGGSGSDPAGELGVAGSGPAPAPDTSTPTPSATDTPTPAPDPGDGFPFPETRRLLLDTAAAHFDPEGAHLPDESSNAGTGGAGDGLRVSTKLGWTVPGEDGLGMVQVAVTTPDYDSEELALSDFAVNIGCDLGTPTCAEQTIPGTDETVWVAEGTRPEQVFAVVHERADGSLVGVQVSTLFGNNSTVPVPTMEIDLEQAFDFVTDHELKVDPQEAKDGPGARATTGPIADAPVGEGEMSSP